MLYLRGERAAVVQPPTSADTHKTLSAASGVPPGPRRKHFFPVLHRLLVVGDMPVYSYYSYYRLRRGNLNQHTHPPSPTVAGTDIAHLAAHHHITNHWPRDLPRGG